ncbi:MAG: hypothetical protein RDU25_01000 [Patescibacteria group bacterium]|nr:hypothetical protein [Patescibacteria group bacterium]
MKLKQTLHNLALIACMTSALLPMPTGATTLQSGDLIKGPGDAVYYYGEDGKRYVFPNLKTYQTWYNDFTGVKALSLDELQAISLAKNVTYKPGVRMIKVESIPKVYAVAANGTLRWITTEDLAESLYGADWNKKIDDLPDGFFVDYKIGAPIVAVADFAPATESASASTINFNLKLTSTPTTPTDTPTSTTPTEPTTPPTAFDFSVSKTNAMAGEIVTLSASAPSVGAISKIELFIDTTLIKSCNAVTACSSDYQIPPSNTASSYVAKAIVTKLDATTLTDTETLTTVANGTDKVTVRLARTQVKPNQLVGVTIDVNSEIAVGRVDIFVDSQIVGSCANGSHLCQWTGYLTNQTLGTVHEVKGRVTSNYETKYTSFPKYVTVSENDEPSITVSPAKDSIYLGEKLDVTVSASDDDGILSIDVMKDGAVLKHCEGAAPCTVSTGPWNTIGTLTFGGKATDALSKTAENTSSPVSVVAQP